MAFEELLTAAKSRIVRLNRIFDPEMQIPGPQHIGERWVSDGRLDLRSEADPRHRFLDVQVTVRVGFQDCNVCPCIVQKMVRALIRIGPVSVALEDLAGR